jgi:TolA-binding protein
MKTILILLVASVASTFLTTAKASGIPVVDAAHIASNRVSHAVDYVQQVLHEANQQTQIGKQVEQIKQLYEQIEQLYTQIDQMDSYLERFGDPKEILDLAGFDQLLGELGKATEGLDIEAKLPDLAGENFFGFDGNGIFEPITQEIEIGDETFERDAERYKPHEAARVTIEQYREKKVEVMERRDTLRAEVSKTA